MPWPGASLRFALLLLATVCGPPGLLADGNVGCLFSETLCLQGIEWCYDDYAFGKCLLANGDNDEDDLFRFNLEREALHELSHELRRLFALGYRWSHAYTQCRLQAMLYATKNDLIFDNNACSTLADQDLEGALKALEGQDQLEPEETAIVKFTPSDDDPHADFADEVYYPPLEDQRNAIRDVILPANAVDVLDMEDPYAEYEVVKRAWIPQMHRRSLPNAQIFSDYNTPANFRHGKETRDQSLEFLPLMKSPEDDEQLVGPILELLEQLNLRPEEYRSLFAPENFEKLMYLMKVFDDNERRKDTDINELLRRQVEYDEREGPERFSITYNTPERFREGWESKDDLPEPRIYFDEGDGEGVQVEEDGSGLQSPPEEIFRELAKADGDIDFNNNVPDEAQIFSSSHRKYPFRDVGYDVDGISTEHQVRTDNNLEKAGFYTEGGVVHVPNAPTAEKDNYEDLGEILEKLDLAFHRPERLDVKKPGPRFEAQISSERNEIPEADVVHPVIKKEPRGARPNSYREVTVNDVDTDYVYVQFKNTLNSWPEGSMIIRNITKLLNIEPSAVSHGRVDRNEVTFKVGPNRQRLNASEIAKKIDLIKEQIKENIGVEVTAAGVGDKTKLQSVITAPAEPPNQFYIVMMMISGILLALLVAGILLLVIRRHIASREKLSGLARPDTEASRDYQDLCRARMAAKGQASGETIHGRITSLSRESEQSPSSRSSTSSWSEEPALHNMDISTGHMVLSYMEDHLKNKDRLEQEWVALCAYVAEPCETSVALKKENIQKNRYPDVMPYDHARVVLNELSNASGSDYINASSITDHDPRNPAYIATQGPLPHTAPDFWQLIWEQGAVVIVMLTRLTEGGAAMCHRYWPEEGSELYHIYEVHLVSEHIWCDDYLVRSFYLKNTRTGETRTVTQFHFLSWPEASVPASTKALLEFRRKVNKSYRGRSCPIVVHCSDGAGRTGTYCLIDMVLSRMAKGAKEIDIAATLEHLRDQRPRMVATKQQFEFVLTAVAEEVHAILKALPPQPTPTPQQAEKQ